MLPGATGVYFNPRGAPQQPGRDQFGDATTQGMPCEIVEPGTLRKAIRKLNLDRVAGQDSAAS